MLNVCIVMQAQLCMYTSCIMSVSLSHSIKQNLALWSDDEINNNHALLRLLLNFTKFKFVCEYLCYVLVSKCACITLK